MPSLMTDIRFCESLHTAKKTLPTVREVSLTKVDVARGISVQERRVLLLAPWPLFQINRTPCRTELSNLSDAEIFRLQLVKWAA